MSIAIGVGSVFAAIWFAAKVFRIGLLMYGKPPNFATLIRWARSAGRFFYDARGRATRFVGVLFDVTDEKQVLETLHQADRPPLPKGQSPVTARLVAEQLRLADDPVTAAGIAEQLGISRATAQRYLAALSEEGRATMTLRYGSTGRPEHRYTWIGRP